MQVKKKDSNQTVMEASKVKFIKKQTVLFLYIESSLEQSVEICKVSGKQVFCIENRKLIHPNNC